MGKSPNHQKKLKLSKLVETIEDELEVSEAEKILSQLALLMNLNIVHDDSLRERLKRIARDKSKYAELSEPEIESLRDIAVALHVKSPRVLFWMWRAWLLQKDIPSKKPSHKAVVGLGDLRDFDEWDWISDEVYQARLETEKLFADQVRLIKRLSPFLLKYATEVSYTFGNIQGSPLAVLGAVETQLQLAQDAIRDMKGQVYSAYGFGQNHRPNKRFDKHSARNITAFFWWKRRVNDQRLYMPFLTEKRGEQAARTAAQKVASRFEEKLLSEFDPKLEQLENQIGIPTRFYARKLTD